MINKNIDRYIKALRNPVEKDTRGQFTVYALRFKKVGYGKKLNLIFLFRQF